MTTSVPDRTTSSVPSSHADLLDQPLGAVLTTHFPSGRLQSTVVWFWHEGDDVLISTMAEFRKARNLQERPRATLLVLEPAGTRRWVEIRAEVQQVPGDGMADLDAVGRLYCGVEPYFGTIVPAHLAEVEHPITFRLVPTAVVAGPLPPRRPRRRATAQVGPVPATPSHPYDDVALPASHHDLLDRPVLAVLSTRRPDGAAQSHPVWCTRDGDVVELVTTLERAAGRNLLGDPRATVLVVDPADSSRWIEVRCDVELVTDGAPDLLDRLAQEYTEHPAYYGHLAPAGLADAETRVIARLHPRRVNCDAIHR
jgi:PPOX class probable F420-dependent enzyme